MSDRTRAREREAEAEASDTRLYEPKFFEFVVDELKRAMTGRIVVHARDRLWDVHKQAKTKRYLSPIEPELQDTATQEWEVFLQDIPQYSGKHRHQGGLVIFVLEGTGHTIIEGERHDWEAGDLMLLPMRPGGVEHQHFNHDPDRPAKWIALVYWPFFTSGGSETTQISLSPIYEQFVKDRS
jgi:quercetin dioxygenase-like cupin family protein